jgi:hypothetical protein
MKWFYLTKRLDYSVFPNEGVENLLIDHRELLSNPKQSSYFNRFCYKNLNYIINNNEPFMSNSEYLYNCFFVLVPLSLLPNLSAWLLKKK